MYFQSVSLSMQGPPNIVEAKSGRSILRNSNDFSFEKADVDEGAKSQSSVLQICEMEHGGRWVFYASFESSWWQKTECTHINKRWSSCLLLSS
jgi:hypothetical protein